MILSQYLFVNKHPHIARHAITIRLLAGRSLTQHLCSGIRCRVRSTPHDTHIRAAGPQSLHYSRLLIMKINIWHNAQLMHPLTMTKACMTKNYYRTLRNTL